MALIGNDHPIVFNTILNLSMSAYGLHHRNIHNATQCIFARSQLADDMLLLFPPFFPGC